MNFTKTRDKIKGFMLASGIQEVHFNKSEVPEQLPAGIVTVAERFGEIPLVHGYAKQGFRFECHIIVDIAPQIEDQPDTELNLLSIIDYIDNELQGELYTEINKVDFYDSMLSAKNVKVARFEVVV